MKVEEEKTKRRKGRSCLLSYRFSLGETVYLYNFVLQDLMQFLKQNYNIILKINYKEKFIRTIIFYFILNISLSLFRLFLSTLLDLNSLNF